MSTGPRLDYRTIVGPGEDRDDPHAGLDRKWWTLPGDEAARSISSLLSVLRSAQEPRLKRYRQGALRYGQSSSIEAQYGRITVKLPFAAPNGRISYNGIQLVTDTITSKITKSKPRPFYLTSGGTFRAHRKAKKRTKMVDGIFYENKSYELGAMAFRDACYWADGLVKVVPRNKRVRHERVLPEEVFVDEVEAAATGSVRQMHHVRAVDRRQLLDQFPEHRDAILARGPLAIANGTQGVATELVEVRESWHLRSGPEADDGRHVITIEDVALTKVEPWLHDFFPFARMPWCKPVYGYWSQSLAEQMWPIQSAHTRIMQAVDRALYKAGLSVTWVPRGANVPKDFITNAVDAVIEYSGDRTPVRETYPIVPPEVYARLRDLEQKMFAIGHLSELAVTAQKPAGLDSKPSLREFSDIESDGFRTIGTQHEAFYIQLARISVAIAHDIAKANGGSYVVQARGRGALEEIRIPASDLVDDASDGIECFPVSSLPRDPSARMQTVTEYVQGGWMTPREGRRLMDFPDLEASDLLANAQEERIIQCLDAIVDSGEYEGPTPEDNLALARELVLQQMAVGRTLGLEPERLELLATYLRQIGAIEQMAAEADAQQASAMSSPAVSQPGGAAGAVPQAPPVPAAPSPLVRNAPGLAA